MDNSIVYAERAMTELGGIPLSVYRLPDGKYRLGLAQILESIDVATNWIGRLPSSSPKTLKALQGKGFTGYVIEISVDKTRAKTLSIEDSLLIWRWFDKQGNEKASAIIDACVAETIERRADRAFKVQRSEEEYEQTTKARIEGKIVRRLLTDAIAEYIKRHPELSDNDKKWMYRNCSDKTNIIVLGKIAKKVAEDLGCDRSNLRDFLQAEQLVRLASMEDLTVRLIDRNDVHPFQSVIQSAERLLLNK